MESGTSVQVYVALRVVAIPAAAALAGIVAARLASARDSTAARVVGAGVGVGAILAHLGIAGVPPIPPIDTIGWIAPAIAAALVLLVVLERTPAAGVVALAACGAASGYLVGKPVWAAMSAGEAAAWIALYALALAAVGSGLSVASRRLHPAAVLAAATLVLIGGAVACVASHSALLAMLMGGFASATGAALVAALILRVPLGGGTLPGVLAVAGGAVVVYARLYSALPMVSVILLAGAALAPVLIGALPRFRARSIVALVLAGALAAGAAALAVRAGAAAEGSPGDDAAEDMYYR